MEVLDQKRHRALGVFFLLTFLAIAARLFYIQVLQNEIYLKKAVSQRLKYEKNAIDRGQIYDKNMIPLTDRRLAKYITINGTIADKETTAKMIAKASGLTEEQVMQLIENRDGEIEIEAKDFSNPYLDMLERNRIMNVSVDLKWVRYSEVPLASHVVGYIGKSDSQGKMGIEKSMDYLLKQGGAEVIATVVGSTKTRISGLGIRFVEPKYEDERYGIQLTLDYHIQRIVEEVLRNNHIDGSIIVMDVRNGDILAMASAPDFDQRNVGQYLTSENNELVNKAIYPYDLGSIFKTVVAAAAIENNITLENETFLCEGEIESNNSSIKCSTFDNHKERPITFKEAFALSCNTTFVKLGTRLGPEKILEMAKRMGFSQKQCNELLEEKAGFIPEVKDEGIGNISIGQGKIQVTPLQVTTMMAAIANNGVKHFPSIVNKLIVINRDGTTTQEWPRSKPEVILKTSTLRPLKEMLREVTLSGTGKQAAEEELGGSSGKTSTAETGIQSGDIIHGWFAGYAPAESPRYAITVFVYNGKSGGKAAAPLFKEVTQKILTEYKPIK